MAAMIGIHHVSLLRRLSFTVARLLAAERKRSAKELVHLKQLNEALEAKLAQLEKATASALTVEE